MKRSLKQDYWFFLWSKGAFLGCALLCFSCASTYQIKGIDYKVKETKPNSHHYAITFCIGFGLGEQFLKPNH